MTNTLRFADLPKRPGPAELDAIMCQVSDQLGEKWTAVRMSGYWLIYHWVNGKLTPTLHQSRKQFINALSDATERTIINDVPLF